MPVFFFTDIERSTQLWEKHSREMAEALSLHDFILRHEIERNGGRLIKHTGDGFFAIFERGEPLECALALQQRIQQEEWPGPDGLRIRIAMYTGEAENRGQDYFGPAVNRCARILATGWGGQILLTPTVETAATLPRGATLEDLGVHLLKDLDEPLRILNLTHPNLRIKSFPPLRSLSSRPHNLPQQPTRFIGRDAELRRLKGQLQDASCSIITLVGLGGTGKTRLALQAAAESIESFAQGVYFIPLAPITSHSFLFSTIADALRFTFYNEQDPKLQLLGYLREKEILLVMDHFDHLADQAGLLSEIVAAAPRVKILTTSRQRLNLQGEWTIEVEGLGFPSGDDPDSIGTSASVQLFKECAQRVRSEITLSEGDLTHVATICRLVEGMPLAIELAASWIRALTCAEISSEISGNIDFLSSSLRNDPEEHRNVRAILNYSWEMLLDQEREILRKLSIFRGGFQRDAAECIVGATLLALSSLVDKSILHRAANGRYSMHELVRQFAADKLSENPREKALLQETRCRFYASFTRQANDHLQGTRQTEILEEFSEEIDNIREGWWHAIEHGLEGEIKNYLYGISHYLELQCLFEEGEHFLNHSMRVLIEAHEARAEQATDSPPIFWWIQARRGMLLSRRGLFTKAKELLEECLAVFLDCGARRDAADCLNNLGQGAQTTGDFEEATRLYQEALALFSELDDKRGMAWSSNLAGGVEESHAHFTQAQELYEEALTLYLEIDAPNGIAWTLTNLGNLAYAQGDFQGAKRLYNRAQKLYTKYRDQAGIAWCLSNLARVHEVFGKYAEAIQLYRESLSAYRELGDRRSVVRILNLLANAAEGLCQFEEAEGLCQESLLLAREFGDKQGIAGALCNLGSVKGILGKYSEARMLYEESLGLFREVSDQSGVAWLLSNLGDVDNVLGNYPEAKKQFNESLEIYKGIGERKGLAWVLANLGNVDLQSGAYEDADRLFNESHDIYKEIGERRGLAWSLMGLGNLARLTHHEPRARAAFQEGLAIYEEIADRKGSAWALTCLGHLEYEEGSYKEAGKCFEDAVAVFKKSGDRRGLAFALVGMGKLKIRQNLLIEGKQDLTAALKIAYEFNVIPLVLDAFVGLAALWNRLSKHARALDILYYVIQHPAKHKETELAATRLLRVIEGAVPRDIIEASRETAKIRKMEDLIKESTTKIRRKVGRKATSAPTK